MRISIDSAIVQLYYKMRPENYEFINEGGGGGGGARAPSAPPLDPPLIRVSCSHIPTSMSN